MLSGFLSRTSLRTRALVSALCLCQFAPVVPVRAQAANRPVERQVTPNRTLPTVTKPPETPQFSAAPSEMEFLQARIFPEPLVPVGDSAAGENRALANALSAYVRRGARGTTEPLSRFMELHSTSVWTPSLLLNIGLVFLEAGYFSRALHNFEYAWKLTKNHEGRHARAIADRAIGERLALLAALGHADQIEALLEELDGRPVAGSAGQQVSLARQSLVVMREAPDEAFRCGPHALAEMFSALRGGAGLEAKLLFIRTGVQGSSLAQLARWSAENGVPSVAVQRQGTVPFPVPSVVHLKAGSGHFAAIVGRDGERYIVRDPTLGEMRVSEQALHEEASGAILAPAGSIPQGWRVLDDEAAGQVWGRGLTTTPEDGGPTDDNPKTPPECPSDEDCECVGMPGYQVDLMMASLTLTDTPLRYVPPIGAHMRFTAVYNQRESHQPQMFTYSNLGPLWTFDWLSFVQDDPASPNATVRLVLGGGGQHTFAGFDSSTGLYARELKTHATLKRVSQNPIRYERMLPDGSVDVFTHADGAGGFPRRVFMTERRNAAGDAITFTYDAFHRLIAAADALGQVTTVAYELPDLWKITRVTDPFGRSARFAYDDEGRLQSIMDTAGLQSSFTSAADGFVTSMTTPYGTTRFTKSEVNGNRTVDIVDPLGGRERVEYRANDGPSQAPANTVPVVPGVTFSNAYLQYRNTLYWNKRAMALGAGDRTKAHVYHWLHVKGNLNQTASVLESEKAPLENRVWYAYPNQAGPVWQGDGRSPSVVARVLDNGTTQVWRATYNALGNITSRTDPAGRQTTFTYAPNNIDITEVAQIGTGGSHVLLTATYDGHHRPLTVTDAAGETTTLTYNADGQLLTVTNPKDDTHTLSYTDHYLQSITGPLSFSMSITYDGFGRIRTLTGTDGYVLTYDYDTADRLTQVTFPDGTSTHTVYDRLDAVRTRDRTSRWTTVVRDALRRIVAVRDPLGRVVRQSWCTCGSLNSLTDAKGQTTTWDRDLQARVTKETRANGSFSTYTYETTTSRLKTIVDARNQTTHYSYTADDRLGAVTYTNAVIATPAVSYAYDAVFPRLTSLTDGVGTTTYTYKAVGTPGAMQVAEVDGPLANDTVTYGYDELGVVVSRALHGVGLTRTFDALGRLTAETNAVGAFSYAYVGATGRVSAVTYPNNQTTTYSYDDDEHDFRLQTIHHQHPSAATLSKFDYTYDVVGNIRTWRQERAGAAAKIYTFTHDVVDQLTTAVLTDTNPTPTILTRQAWAYDAAGNRTVDQQDDAVFASTHDAMNRLQSRAPGGPIVFAGSLDEPGTVTIDGKPAAVDASHRFRGTATLTGATTTVTVQARDASGNETTHQYAVDASGSTTNYTYDANGNLTSDGAKTYFWNALNQLVEVKEGTTTLATFEYDGEGRRTEKIAAGLTHQYIYDAEDIVEERITGSSSDTIRYYHGAGIDEPLARKNAADVVTYYLADHLGSIVQETSASGSVTLDREYDPWGVTMQGASTSGYAFTGREWDAETGLSFYRARYYSPLAGRFLTDDPLGPLGGLNLYAYSDNRPARMTDPFGLCSNQPGGAYDPKKSGPEDPTNPGQPLHSNPVVRKAAEDAWRKTTNGTARGGRAESGFAIQYRDGTISIAYETDTVYSQGTDTPNRMQMKMDRDTIALYHTHGNSLSPAPGPEDYGHRVPLYVRSRSELNVVLDGKTAVRLPRN